MTDAVRRRAETVEMIRAGAAGLLAKWGGLPRVRALRWQPGDFDRNVWRDMAGAGWVGLRLPEAVGGAGLGMLEFCALAEEMGAALAPEPLIACAHAGALLSGSCLSTLLTGERVVIPAWQECAHALDAGPRARMQGGRVNAVKMFVPSAAAADAYLVTTSAGTAWVERHAPGVALAVEPTVDGGHFGTLTLSDARAEGIEQGSLERFDRVADESALATAAYLLGVMERSFALTLDYLRIRSQFGRVIGSYQVLQHRMVDLRIQIALTRASVGSAAQALDAGVGEAARRVVVSLAKARAADAAMLVTRQAVQLHGAIGYTDDCDVGLYLRKAMVHAGLYGSSEAHRARYASLETAGVGSDGP